MAAGRSVGITPDTRRSDPSLLDREAELAHLRDAVQATAGGEARVVLVEGTPGAGKSRLLAEARTLVSAAGLRVLSACGSELEREHPYGVVRQLFEADLLGPAPEDWLAGPAAAATSVFRPDAAVAPAPFATLGGLYWLTAAAAADGPLAVLVDDLHWADRPSLHYLQYLVRRLEGLPVLLVLGGRPGDNELLADVLAGPSSAVLRPAPLTAEAAARLSHELLGVRPGARFADACWRAAGGNPLLLVELLRTLRAEGVAPVDAHVGAVARVGSSAVARVALVRLRRLGAEVVAVAQAIALLGDGAATPVVAATAGVDENAVAPAVAALVDAEVLDAQPPLRFVHAIVRDAVYREVPPDERDRRHARAAELLHARAAEPGRVGAHLLLTAPRGERWIVSVLMAAAADATQRGAVESALTSLRRAVVERPADIDPELLLRLGLTEAGLDPEAAVEHLRAALRADPDAARRAQTGELITRLLVFTRPTEAIAAARQARAELGPAAEDRAAALDALERYAGRFAGAAPPPPLVADPTSSRGRMLIAVQAWDRALSGGTAADCVAQAAEALLLDAPGGRAPVYTQNGLLTAMIGSTVLMLADDPRAQALWDDWHAEAVRAGRAHAVIAGAVWRGWLHLRRGELADAEASLRTALEGPRRWGPGTETASPAALGLLADVQLERGDLSGARATLERVAGRGQPRTEGELIARCREHRLLVLDRRFADALDATEAVRDRLETVRNPAWYPWRSVRAEALAGLGRTDEAIGVTAEELDLARRWGTPAPIGRALTLLGTLEGSTDRLEEAVETTRGPLAGLEHARALLALGRELRRRRRPSEARAPLRDAHELALQFGATPVARAAKEELGAAGGRPRAAAGGGPASLTPSERRVAELAAAGRRNQEIAQQLYVSLKTVEVHLTSSYRKLGIRARAELAAALGRPGAAAPTRR